MCDEYFAVAPEQNRPLSLTLRAQVQALHIEDTITQGNLLQDDPKAVDVSLLGSLCWGHLHTQELRGRPQFL